MIKLAERTQSDYPAEWRERASDVVTVLKPCYPAMRMLIKCISRLQPQVLGHALIYAGPDAGWFRLQAEAAGIKIDSKLMNLYGQMETEALRILNAKS